MPASRPATGGSGTDDVAALFDTESEAYDEAHEGPQGVLMRLRMQAVLDALGPGPGDVLDAGMGPGRLLVELAARGWTVWGVDISEQMVALAAARLPDARGRLTRGSIAELPFEDDRFDAVVATGVIEYLDDPVAGVGELLRVVRPGGVVAVSMPNLSSVNARWKGRVWYPAMRAVKRAAPGLTRRPAPYVKPGLMRLPELLRTITAAGASPVMVRHMGIRLLPAPLDRPTRRLAARLEGSSGRAGRVLAMQVVVAARLSGPDR